MHAHSFGSVRLASSIGLFAAFALMGTGCGDESPAAAVVNDKPVFTLVKVEPKPLEVRITVVGVKPTTAVVVIEFSNDMVRFTASYSGASYSSEPNRHMTIYPWALTGLTPDTTDIVTVTAIDIDGQRAEAWAPLITPPAPVAPVPEEEKLELIFSVESLTSLIGRATYKTNKPATVDIFRRMAGNQDSLVYQYGQISQEGAVLKKMFWAEGSERATITVVAYTDDGEVVRYGNIPLDSKPVELETTIITTTSTTVTVQWAAKQRDTSYSNVVVHCWQPNWHTDGQRDPRSNVMIGWVEVTGLTPGGSFDCQAQADDYVSGLPVKSDSFFLHTPP